jgi:dienelactone hydrolase
MYSTLQIFKKALLFALVFSSALSGYAFSRKALPVEEPVIFNAGETAKPGEAFGMQGYHFGQSPQLWIAVIKGDEKVLKPVKQIGILSWSDINLSAILPTDTNIHVNSLIAVWVKNGSGISKPVFLNRARAVTLEFDEIMPGQTFRIFGRNLKAKGANPVIRFDAPGQKPAYASYVSGEPYIISLVAPVDIKPGVHYKITVSNGIGAKWGENTAEQSVLIRPAVADPFGLKVAWGTDFDFYKNIYNVKTDDRLLAKAKGDGYANDRDAIQKAIDKANKDGGGVVYLSSGTYKLDFAYGSGLVMRSKVVLKGDGPDKTNIQYGFGTPPPYPDPIGKGGWPDTTTNGVAILWPLGTTLTGLYGLQVQNVNTSGIWKHSMKNMPAADMKPGAGGSKFFVSNCRFDLAVAWGLSWGHVDRFMITDCIFESHAKNTWPWQWHCNGATNFVVRNNTIRYSAGRFGFNDSANGILENNHFIRLGDEQMTHGESGGFNIDYASNIIILKNHMEVVGRSIDPKVNNNQGETILSQGGNPENQDAATVTGATANSLSDASDKWKFTIRKPSLGCSDAVAIVAGKGAGQWRFIAGNTSNTIQVEKPWDVIPDKDSYYVIMRWSARDWLVKDNILEGNNRGIWFYCGDNDVAIVGNKLTNSDGIYIRSDQRITGNERGRFNLSWNTIVERNEVIDDSGLRPAYVNSTMALGVPFALHGIGTIGLEVRNNYVQAHTPNAKSFIAGEGYWNTVESKNPATTGQVAILGTIFENNKAVNTDIAYRLSPHSSQTIIKNPVNRNVKTVSTDSLGQDKQSEKTIWITSLNNIAKDPFTKYLTGNAPQIIKDLGEVTDSIKLRQVIFRSRNLTVNGQTIPTDVYAVIARPLQAGNYPGILVLHGGGGTAEVDKARRWAAKGYIAVAIDIPGIVPPDKVPNSTGLFKTYKYGDHRFTASPDVTTSTIFDGALAVVQAFYLLRSQPDVVKDRIGVTGISWGGYMTTMLSGLIGPYIQASFSSYGCGFYDEGSTFQKGLDAMAPSEKECWLTYLDAGRRAKNINAPFFIASATNDIFFYPPAVSATLNAINSPVNHFFAPNVSHTAPIAGGNISNDRVGWMQMEQPYFDYYLKGIGEPLPRVYMDELFKEPGTADTGNYTIRIFVTSKTPITEADVYYSAADPLWPKRKWIAVKATPVKDGWYQAQIPINMIAKGTYCFASVSDSRPVTVSSDLKEYK